MCPDSTPSNSLNYFGILKVMLLYLIFIVIVYAVTYVAFSGLGFSDSREQTFITIIAAVLGAIIAIFMDRMLKLIGLI